MNCCGFNNNMIGMFCKVRLCVPALRLGQMYNRTNSALPRITVPHMMTQKTIKIKQKAAAKSLQEKSLRKRAVVISCKRSQYNHHKGQTYSDFSPQSLASGGWLHYKSKGDHFTVHPISNNPSLSPEDTSICSFNDLNINPKLTEVLSQNQLTTPTNIQALTIPRLLEGRNVLCCAETGSGKTLAFLLPILHNILQTQDDFSHNQEANQPSAVILTPLRELADQIYNVCKDLCEDLPIKMEVICGGRGTQKILRNPPISKLDILITTPGVFSKLLTNKIYNMSRLTHLVFDEADSLLDDSFNAQSLRLIQKMKIQSETVETSDGFEDIGTQVSLVGATMPRDLQNILPDLLPVSSFVKVTTRHLHHVMPHVPQKFVRLSPTQCPEFLLTHLKKNISIPTLVFCKNYKTAMFVHLFLQDNGVKNIVLHAQMAQKSREGRFEDFQNGVADVLVCTDIASRGLDTKRAQHVINYNFPEFLSDYIHRAGRVGRVGSNNKGFVLNFVCYKWDVNVLWEIETSIRRMTQLHNVNANIKRKLSAIIDKKFNNDSISSEDQLNKNLL